ncbi:MAG: N-acetylmuramoyl-L-alanine amidase [Defluviitaleaceae bacterium]|nr:N-acetylmuramoyl-L-alanine amidase [Defluviitaleaceae bacterium]
MKKCFYFLAFMLVILFPVGVYGAATSYLARDVSSAPIQSESHPVTNIVGVLTPRDSGAAVYAIRASSAISRVNHFLLPDNRLVVDIYNARLDITGPFLAYGPVGEIRTSQFSRSPYVTRFVFELASWAEYSVSISYDRRVLTVAFAVNNITLTTTSEIYSDTLIIRGDFLPSIRLSSVDYPAYLAIYVSNAAISSSGEFLPEGAFVSHFETEELANGVAKIRVFMHYNWPSISLTHGADYVIIILHRGLNGIRYDISSRELRLCRETVGFMDIGRVRHNNEYLRNRYALTLPIPADGLGLGTLYVADNQIYSITVRRNSSGNAQLVFTTSRVMGFTVHETESEYIIRAHLPQELYSFIIVIDPGHGGRDPGTVHHGLRESDIVLAISHMVAERLSYHSEIKVYMTRHTDVSVTLAQRTSFANQMADLFVSIHVNAVRNRPHVSGIETWYLPHSREDNLGFTSRQFARIMQRSIINATNAVDRGIKNNRNFAVIRDTLMPAVLMEVGFLSNADDAALLETTAYQELIAQAIYEGIIESFGRYNPPR